MRAKIHGVGRKFELEILRRHRATIPFEPKAKGGALTQLYGSLRIRAKPVGLFCVAKVPLAEHTRLPPAHMGSGKGCQRLGQLRKKAIHPGSVVNLM